MRKGAGLKLILALYLIPAPAFHSQTVPSPLTTPTARPVAVPAATPAAVQLDPFISLQDAMDLAGKQVNSFRNSQLNEGLAAEDVKQARAAFLPKVTIQPNFQYTSPSLARTVPREPSFLGADAIYVYQGIVNAAGEIDTSGRLAASLRRNLALLEAAKAGSEVARRDLGQAVTEAYLNLELSAAKRRGAESNLMAAREFEHNTKLNVDAGESAPVDLVRARLQTAARFDELEQAKTEEAVNADALRFLVGYDLTRPIAASDLLLQMPAEGEIDRFAEAAITARPEFTQFAAEMRAAQADVSVARSERRPQFTYSGSAGFISDSMLPVRLKDHLGVQINVGVTIPIFDAGASRSRETQARLKAQQAGNSRAIAERQFRQEFFAARTQAISAAARIKQIGASLIDAEQNVIASTARYRAGEAPINEVTEAQNLLVAQRQLLYQAIFDYQTAKARLARAVGQ
jgi:outer membrane protein TolC